MRKSAIIGAALAAATAMTLTGVATAAANEASQDVTFSVSATAGGGLSVLTGGPVSTVGLVGQSGVASGATTVFGVIDQRGGKTGWTASVALSDFEYQGEDGQLTVPATAATYSPMAAVGEVLGGSATAPSSSIGLKNDPTPVMVRSDRNLNAPYEHVSWGGGMKVELPEDQPVAVGQYKATLTLSAY